MMGLYRTDDEGLTWRLVHTDNFAASQRTRMTYAGSGVSQRIYGIRKLKWGSSQTLPAVSDDGGRTWVDLAEPEETSEEKQYYSLVADPAGASESTQRLVMDNYRKLWFSPSGDPEETPWIEIHSERPDPATPESYRLAGVAWDGSTIYVGTNVGIFVSTNNGADWDTVAFSGFPTGGQIVEFCGAKHPNTGDLTLFAIIIDSGGDFGDSRAKVEGWDDIRDVDEVDRYLGLYTIEPGDTTPVWSARSGPGGIPFARVDVPASDSTKPWAATSPYLSGGASVYKANTTTTPWSWTRTLKTGAAEENDGVSTGFQGDGGVLSWAWSYPALGLDVSDSDPDRVIVTGDFPYLTDDGGDSWMQMYVNPATDNPAGQAISPPKSYQHSGLGVTTGHWLHWVSSDIILAAGTDIGVQRSADGGATWTIDHTPTDVNGLDPSNWYCLAKQPGTGRIYAAVSNVNDFYEEERLSDEWMDDEYGDVRYSDDNGITWASLSAGSSGLPDNQFPGPVITVAVDHDNPSHIYAASASSVEEDDEFLGGFYRSTNGGAAWSKLPNPEGTEGRPLSIHVLDEDELVVTYCARIDENGDHTASSGVFYSDDGGSEWVPRMHADMAYYTRDLVVSPNDASHWFAAVQSTRTVKNHAEPEFDERGGVYRTQNKGGSWTRIFAHDGVQSVTYMPGTSPLLYVTTSNEGLWVITEPDSGSPGLFQVVSFPFARVRRVFAEPNCPEGRSIWVTTQGGGLWRGTVEATMKAALLWDGTDYHFQVDVLDAGGSVPVLTGILDLGDSPLDWTELTSLTPDDTSLGGGWTRYLWSEIQADTFFSGGPGYVRAQRMRVDDSEEVSESGGWITETIETTHTESLSSVWLKPEAHRTPVCSLNGAGTSTLRLEVPYTGGFDSGYSYYAEIIEGALEGHRFEVDESASSVDAWVLDLSNALNTTDTAPTLNGQQVVLRQHWRLDELFPKSVFRGTSNASTSDTLQIWENGAWQGYWRLQASSLNRWVKQGDATLAERSALLIPPAAGVLVQAKASGADREAPSFGLVRSHSFRHIVDTGHTFLGLGFATSNSFNSYQMNTGSDFVATTNASTADQILIWLGDATPGSSGYDTFFFLNSPLRWVKSGDATIADQGNALHLKPHRGFFILSRNVKSDWLVPRTWVP